MNRFRRFKWDLLAIAGFLLLPLLLYGNVTLGNKTMLPLDNLAQWEPWTTDSLAADAPHNGLITDLIIQNYAWKKFAKESIQNWDIPLWQPYLFAGTPFWAAGQHSLLYPFSVLFWIMPLTKAYGWYTVSQLWLTGVLMYVYGRILRMRRSSAAMAGLIYQGSGFMLTSAAVFPMIIGAAAWLPLLLGCIEMIVRGMARRDQKTAANNQIVEKQTRALWQSPLIWVVIGAITLACQIFAGHVEITYYSLLIMALYALWRLLTPYKPSSNLRLHIIHHSSLFFRPAFTLLAMVLLGLMLGAVQLLPLFEVGQSNFREGSASFAEVQTWAFPKRRIVTLLAPNFFGNPTHHDYVDVVSGGIVPFTTNYYGDPNPRGATTSDWGIKNYVEGGIYLGVLALFLAGLGIGIKGSAGHDPTVQGTGNGDQDPGRRSITLFFLILSLLSLAFIFGTPLYALLYYGLPFINQLHTPFRWVFPLSLAIATLAGFGLDHLARTRQWQTQAQWHTFAQKFANNRKEMVQAVWASDSTVQSAIRPFFLWGKPSPVTALAGLAFWSGTALLLGLFVSRFAYGSIASVVERVFLGLALAPDAFPSAQAFFSYEWRQFFLLGLMLVASGASLRVSRCPIWLRGKPIYLYMIAVTILVDLLIANYGFNAATDPALLDNKPALVQWLEQQPGQWRITSFAPNGDKPFNANSGWLYNIQDIRGYDSIIPRQFTAYMSAIEPQTELPFNRIQPIKNWESLNSPLLDVLNVKYIITAETIDLPKLQLAWEGDGLRVYENLAVAPRAYTITTGITGLLYADDPLLSLQQYDPRYYLVFNQDLAPIPVWWETPGVATVIPVDHRPKEPATYQPAEIISYGNREVIIKASIPESARGQHTWLVLNDSYAPGWKAFATLHADKDEEVSEEEALVLPVNGNFRAVQLHQGEWTIRFRYSPTSFTLGALGSFMAGIILLFAVGIWGWQRLVKPDTEMSLTRSLAKNSAMPMLLNLFNKFIDFGFAAFYLRFLGPVESGSYAYAIATAGFFDIVANFGLNILLIRDVSQDRSLASRYLLNTTVLRLGTGLVGALPVLVYLGLAAQGGNPPTGGEITAVLLIMAGMVFSGMAQGVTGLFYVHERAEVPAAMTTATTILKVGFGVLALLVGFGFVGLAAVSILTNIVTLSVLAVLAFRQFELPGPWRVDWRLQGTMLSKGYPLMLIHLLQTVFISIDVVILRTMLDNGREVVGWYNSAYKWFNALQIVPSFFTLALFPVISREIQRDMAAARRMYQMALKLMLLLALPVAVVTSVLAVPLVQLVAGDEFLPHGAIALQIVIWSIPLGWLNSVTNYVLISLGLERLQPRAFALAVGFNIVTNILFIPRYGYQAAAVTTILSEVVLLVLFDYYLRQRMAGGVAWRQLLQRPLLLTLIMLGLIWLGSQLHVIAGVLLGVLIYPAGLLVLNVIGDAERQVLRQILPGALVARMKQ